MFGSFCVSIFRKCFELNIRILSFGFERMPWITFFRLKWNLAQLICIIISQGYLKSLGMARTAEVKRDARIGEAEARCDAQIKEAIAEEQRMASRFLNDTEIAKAQRDFELKKAAYDVEVQTKKAEAEMAYELQAAKTKQRIKEEQMQIKVVERTQEIAVQDQEMVRRERELEATVFRPAEAEKYRLEKIAEANRNKVMLEAEAEAESVIMNQAVRRGKY